ncbi:MAG: hypothetical protein HFH94_03535 [Lachnospiraceae bacterium]|nr:hypothetical protein [uncultured Acetatifactor sp.]MCI9218798.1 hypothetical protein [Lachnospiraceae bacterium]
MAALDSLSEYETYTGFDRIAGGRYADPLRIRRHVVYNRVLCCLDLMP